MSALPVSGFPPAQTPAALTAGCQPDRPAGTPADGPACTPPVAAPPKAKAPRSHTVCGRLLECRGCGLVKRIRRRMLCESCYNDPATRARFPRTQRQLEDTDAELPPAPQASLAPPGSPERQAAYAERVRAGRAVFHPADLRLTRENEAEAAWVPDWDALHNTVERGTELRRWEDEWEEEEVPPPRPGARLSLADCFPEVQRLKEREAAEAARRQAAAQVGAAAEAQAVPAGGACRPVPEPARPFAGPARAWVRGPDGQLFLYGEVGPPSRRGRLRVVRVGRVRGRGRWWRKLFEGDEDS